MTVLVLRITKVKNIKFQTAFLFKDCLIFIPKSKLLS